MQADVDFGIYISSLKGTKYLYDYFPDGLSPIPVICTYPWLEKKAVIELMVFFRTKNKAQFS